MPTNLSGKNLTCVPMLKYVCKHMQLKSGMDKSDAKENRFKAKTIMDGMLY